MGYVRNTITGKMWYHGRFDIKLDNGKETKRNVKDVVKDSFHYSRKTSTKHICG